MITSLKVLPLKYKSNYWKKIQTPPCCFLSLALHKNIESLLIAGSFAIGFLIIEIYHCFFLDLLFCHQSFKMERQAVFDNIRSTERATEKKLRHLQVY